MCADIVQAIQPLLVSYDPQQIVVVTTTAVSAARSEVAALGYPVLTLPDGEAAKSLATVQQIWDFLLDHRITRRGLLICIGGGVLTDLGGLAASTYKRGIAFIHIPTTLLAMVDASSGGKTGINYRGLKNVIGTFAMPLSTLICPSLLSTLPPREMLSGFAEMLKTGLLDPGDLWQRLLRYDLETLPVEPLHALIDDCLAVKQRIVSADPHEEGLRKALNLGHTFGHALEEKSLDEPLPHGYAVLYGLIAELYLSVTKLGCPREPLQQLTQLMLHYYGRPQCKCSDRQALISLMQQDKKNERTAEINCTLLSAIGQPAVNTVITPAEADEALEYLFSL